MMRVLFFSSSIISSIILPYIYSLHMHSLEENGVQARPARSHSERLSAEGIFKVSQVSALMRFSPSIMYKLTVDLMYEDVCAHPSSFSLLFHKLAYH